MLQIFDESITYAKSGDGIGEHANGSKIWDNHSMKRSRIAGKVIPGEKIELIKRRAVKTKI